MTVSIIICTRNRAESLRATLESIGKVAVPDGLTVELLVVDNGSTDHTRVVVSEARLSNLNLRYVSEPKPGKCHACNTGLSITHGEIILCTDEDICPAPDWLEKIVPPLLKQNFDAVVGRIESAEHLRRPWMEPFHKTLLTLTGLGWVGCMEREMVGANMGFRRSVLERVPAFDPELGPGALGFGEDTLFSWQLCEAGYRLCRIPEALVVHHFEPARLLHAQWLAAARNRGRTSAYLLHHWQHGKLKLPLFRYYYLSAKLFIRRILQPPPKPDEEGCPPWEMSYLAEMELCRQFIKERRRPRNYARHGLKKKPPDDISNTKNSFLQSIKSNGTA